MTVSMFFVLLSAVYISPHVSETSGKVLASVALTADIVSFAMEVVK